MSDIIVVTFFAAVVGIIVPLVLVRVRAVGVISFSRCRLVDYPSLESREQQKQASEFTAIRTSLLFDWSLEACSFNFLQFVRLEFGWCTNDRSGVSAVCLDWAVAELEETVCVGCMAGGCCGSIVITSGGCSGRVADAFML